MNIRDASLNYLTYRNRTVREMREYLEKKKYSEEEIENEIEELKEMRYLNDIEFAQMFFRYSFDQNRGMRRIKRELMNKGVSEFDFEDAIAAFEEENECCIKDDEKERAMRAAEKIMKGLTPDRKVLAKLSRRLNTLGYSSDIIYSVTGYYMREINE